MIKRLILWVLKHFDPYYNDLYTHGEKLQYIDGYKLGRILKGDKIC